jgi:heat shock protein HslJ
MKTKPLLVALCGLTLSSTFAQTVDTIYYNGSILTMAGTTPAYVEALAVKDGKIAFVGSQDAALKMKTGATKIVDLGGKALLPGFLDAHIISRAGAEIGPDQRVTVYEGLKSMTVSVAEHYDEQATKGTLETGKLADLVILDKDPLQVAPLAIKDIKVVETIKEGVTIYSAPAGGTQPLVAAAQDSGKTNSWTDHDCDMADINSAAHKEWTLTTLNGKPVEAKKPLTLKFEHGRVSAFGGVNRLSGSYALVGETVTLGQLIGTRRAGEPALMQQEQDFAKTLATVDSFKVSGDQLTLSSKGTVVALFRVEQPTRNQ